MARTPKSWPPPGRVPPTWAPCQLASRHTALGSGRRRPHAPKVPFTFQSNEIEMRPIFEFIRTGTGAKGKVEGEFRATGYLPTFLTTFIVMGLVNRGEPYL